MSNKNTLLKVSHLRTYFDTEYGLVRAVDDVSFKIDPSQIFALVGESGCGKSVTAFSILQLLQMPPAIITSKRQLARRPELASGSPSKIEFAGSDLLEASRKELRQVRGSKLSMFFQEPMSSLNPVFTCGSQIAEAVRLHQKLPGAQVRQLSIDMLAKVGIPDPVARFNEYPHQLSGGMRQRIMIAMALSCNPQLLIADEPTTALDVTIQAQILDLLKELRQDEGLSIMLITHDLAVVAETADVVAVMYAGKIVELASVADLFANPLHPYTQGLMRCLPRLGEKKHRLEAIEGTVPSPLALPPGCRFCKRCPIGRDKQRCQDQSPPLKEIKPGHWAACWECPGYKKAPETDPAGTSELMDNNYYNRN